MAKKRDSLASMSKSHRSSLAIHLRTKNQIERLVKRLMADLWLGQWDIGVTYEWNGIEGPACATSNPDWRYMHGQLTFDVPRCSTLNPTELRNVVLHELLHVVVNEMREDGIAHEERVVTHLERIVGRLLNVAKEPQ